MRKRSCGLFVLLALSVRAQWVSQSIPLVAGWNAVHLAVQPSDDTCEAVFAGQPVTVVSWWCRDVSALGGGGPQVPDMRSWYPGNPAASTFHRMLGDGCYLIEASSAATLTVKGVPALPTALLWLGRPNLVGMHVPLPNNVMLSEYFAFFGGLGAGYPYATVSTDNTTIQRGGFYKPSPGQALWVTTEGAGEASAEYSGPFNVTLDSPAAAIAFTGVLSPRTLSVKNNAGVARTVRINRVASEAPPAGQGALAGDVPLLRAVIDWSAGYPRETYVDIAFPWVTNIAANATLEVKLLPKLAALPPSTGAYQSILVISDQGSADNNTALTQGRCTYRVGVRAAGDLAEQAQPAGLWVGNVVLDGVNRAQMLSETDGVWDPTNIQSAPRTFGFRVLLHVDEYGQTRLLKEVFQASVPQGSPNAGNTLLPSKEAARNFRAQNPAAVIRRISTAGFPFMPPLSLEGGGFAVADAELSGNIVLAFDDRVNPFVHGFHPDHDNLEFPNGVRTQKDGGADGTGDYESWSVARQVTFAFAASDPTGSNPRWHVTETGGVYTETVTGLSKTEIRTSGAFRLSKVSDVPRILTVSGPE